MRICGLLDRVVEMLGVLGIEVRRRQVGATAEPPGDRLGSLARRRANTSSGIQGVFGCARLVQLEVTVVHMNGRRVGVPRVQYDRDARRKERHALILVLLRDLETLVVCPHLLDSSGWQFAMYDRDVNSTLLEHSSSPYHARRAFPALRTEPMISFEFGSLHFRVVLVGWNRRLELFEAADNTIL